VSGGRAADLEITVKGFEDSLRKLDQADATAAELFRDRLKTSALFADAVIKRLPPIGPKDYVREFTLWATLKRPLVLE
jgi:hypothetical protein